MKNQADTTSGLCGWRDKALFTPGPLTTSRSVKQRMMMDYGSRDTEFIGIVADIRRRLLDLAGVSSDTHTAVLLQGSGTYGLEAAVHSCLRDEERLLVAVNGAYGKRMADIASKAGKQVVTLHWEEDAAIDCETIRQELESDPGITHVAACHCETTSGVLNPIEALGALCRKYNKHFIVDAMSSFGAIPLNLEESGISLLISSANKCIEGVPGFCFVLADKDFLASRRDISRSTVLDLQAQAAGLDGNGQFRFTPPTHVLAAFHQALLELESEGGVSARHERYKNNHRILVMGMDRLGFKRFLRDEIQAPIITSFFYPPDPAFDFVDFYTRLSDQGYVIYPGKVGKADCFRVGNIGRLFPADIFGLLDAIRRVLTVMGVQVS
jgi:2-aminoethylphosphonate-pyruvate transaminase